MTLEVTSSFVTKDSKMSLKNMFRTFYDFRSSIFFRFFKFYFWSKSLHFVRSKQVFLKPWKLTTFLLRSFIFRCPKNLGNKEDSTLKYFFFCKKMSILFAFRMLVTSFRNSNVYSQSHLQRKNVSLRNWTKYVRYLKKLILEQKVLKLHRQIIFGWRKRKARLLKAESI
jgi:hypothetical protein